MRKISFCLKSNAYGLLEEIAATQSMSPDKYAKSLILGYLNNIINNQNKKDQAIVANTNEGES